MRDRLILTAAALVAFGASLGSSFHFDDYAIFADPVLTSPSGWWEVWRPVQTRPLTYFTFWLNYQLGGRNPVGYHAVNLVLHLAAVLLLYDVLVLVGQALSPALLAAALFAVHPIQAEPVNYIWARSTLLMTVFCLLSWRSWTTKRYALAVVWFGVALLAKEECVAFPLFLLLCGGPGPRRAIAGMLAFAAAAGARVLYALHVTPGAPAGEHAGISPLQYALAQGPVIWRYLRLLAVPWGFTVDPDIPIPPLWLGLAAWAGLAAIIWLWRRNRWFAGGFILLAPSSSLLPAADLAADRRMYLPLVAFSAAAALGLQRLPRKVVAVAVAALAIVSISRTWVWMSEKSLWTEAVRRAPDKVRPKIQLARASNPAEATNILADAKKLAPDDPAVASESGKVLLLLGRPQEALPEFGRALALSPRDAQAFNNRGVALQALRQAVVARRDFEHALELDPCLFDPRYNLMRLGVVTQPPRECRYSAEQRRLLASGR
jgi:tetratricopeptide (TPR) repeat protein